VTSHRPRRAASLRAGAAAAAALALVAVGGCARSARTIELPGVPVGEPALVRIGPLVSEHPLYPEVAELSRALEERPKADVKSITEFMVGPLGRAPAVPAEGALPAVGRFAAQEAEADAALAQDLENARQLLASWPQTEATGPDGRLSRRVEEELQSASDGLALRVVRAQRAAVEERAGELAELRYQAASPDAAEAARAVERQAAIWREIGAEGDAVRRQADEELRQKRRETDRKLQEGTRAMLASVEERQATHLRQLEESGGAVRAGQREAANAAVRAVEPGSDRRETPPPPSTDEFAALLRAIESEQRAAWERRRARLAAARSELLDRVARNTVNAIRSVALQAGVAVRFDAPPGQDLPDATESFRLPLRRYWAAQPVAPPGELAARTR